MKKPKSKYWDRKIQFFLSKDFHEMLSAWGAEFGLTPHMTAGVAVGTLYECFQCVGRDGKTVSDQFMANLKLKADAEEFKAKNRTVR